MQKCSIVIPCFNEEAVLPELFKRLGDLIDKQPDIDWEIICVDDGSQDRTWELLSRFQADNPNWKVISFSRNFGHQAALGAGLSYVAGDMCIILDADLQDPPEVIPQLIAKWRAGYEVVYGVRKKRKEVIWKRVAYAGFYRLMAFLVHFDVPLDSGDFCLMDRKVVDILKQMPEQNRFMRGLRSWSGFRQVGLEYERAARFSGEPKYTFRKLFRLALDGLFSFSAFPLRLSAIFGFIISGFALLGVIFTLAQRIFADFFLSIGLAPVPGYATIVIAILMLGGIQLIFLGLIGEYIYRIYQEVKGRPRWIIKETLGL